MKIEIEITEEELKEAVLDVMAKKYYSEYSADRRSVDKVVAECIREIIYKDKDRIVDLIVARSSRECQSKAVKKILKMVGEE